MGNKHFDYYLLNDFFFFFFCLKGTATLMITTIYMKDLKKNMNFDASFI